MLGADIEVENCDAGGGERGTKSTRGYALQPPLQYIDQVDQVVVTVRILDRRFFPRLVLIFIAFSM